jgi:hypothetical protein
MYDTLTADMFDTHDCTGRTCHTDHATLHTDHATLHTDHATLCQAQHTDHVTLAY